jgi:hypothetical protein
VVALGWFTAAQAANCQPQEHILHLKGEGMGREAFSLHFIGNVQPPRAPHTLLHSFCQGDSLRERLIGQDPAVDAVATALMRARCGLKDANRPVASLLLVGPTGECVSESWCGVVWCGVVCVALQCSIAWPPFPV